MVGALPALGVMVEGEQVVAGPAAVQVAPGGRRRNIVLQAMGGGGRRKRRLVVDDVWGGGGRGRGRPRSIRVHVVVQQLLARLLAALPHAAPQSRVNVDTVDLQEVAAQVALQDITEGGRGAARAFPEWVVAATCTSGVSGARISLLGETSPLRGRRVDGGVRRAVLLPEKRQEADRGRGGSPGGQYGWSNTTVPHAQKAAGPVRWRSGGGELLHGAGDDGVEIRAGVLVDGGEGGRAI